MSGQGAGMAQTDGQGRFEIAQLPTGRYTVTAMRSGFVTQAFGQRAPNQPGTPIEIGDGEAAEKVAFALSRGGAVSGRIVTDDGTVPPFRPQQVRIFPQREDPTRPDMGMMPSTVKDDWTFEVAGLTDRVRLRWSIDVPGGGWSLKGAMKDNVDLTPTDGYCAIAVQGLERGAFSDPGFLAPALGAATPVEVREGETQTLNLTMTVPR